MMGTANVNVPLLASNEPREVTENKDAIVKFEELLAEYTAAPVLEELATYVKACFNEAEDHRRSNDAERDILRAMRAWASQYDPEDIAALAIGPGTDVFLPLTNLKCRALRSWLHDILANAEDKPWTIKPTPSPELPEDATEAVVDALMDELNANGYDVDLRERAAYFKDLAQKHVERLSERATKRMEARIDDNMIEGGWRETFGALISDIAVFPTAFVKGPSVTRVTTLRWSQGSLRQVKRLRYTLKRVHPLDVFPSPSSTGPQDGGYIIERMRLSQSEMLDLTTIPGALVDAIRGVLAVAPAGFQIEALADKEREDLEGTDTPEAARPSQTYEVLAYYGKLEARTLIPYGVEIDDPQAFVEAEVYVCKDMVIRAVLNPHPLGRRPFYATSFETVPGSIWGRSLPSVLRDTQRVANSCARAMVKNMAFSSGPIGEYDVDRMAHESNIEDVEPYRMYATQNDAFQPQTSPALRFQTIPSVAKELLMVLERFGKIADDVSGIPAYVIGNPQVAGAGRTLGGLSLLMGNAAKGIKLVVSNIDRDIIEPIVEAYYVMHMLFEEDATLKADATVIARGAAGLLQRELMQARSIEVLNMLTPYASADLVPKAGLQNVLRDVLRSLGYTADEVIPDPERQQQLAKLAAQLSAHRDAGVLPRPAAPPTAMPQISFDTGPRLDRRSVPAPGPDTLDVIPSQE